MNTDNRYTAGYMMQFWGPLWYIWLNSGGESGEEPPAWVKEAAEIDTQRWSVVPGNDEYQRLWEAGRQWHLKTVPAVTIVDNIKQPTIASSRLGNMPTSGIGIGVNYSGEQFFFKE
jgi:peptide/nickel transport system substrate-binding protein